jgi:hypothetical protein
LSAAEERLTARPPTRFEAGTLELDPGEWVVQVLRASYSSEDTPVHTLETICGDPARPAKTPVSAAFGRTWTTAFEIRRSPMLGSSRTC